MSLPVSPTVKSLIGAPYRSRGRSPQEGFDCLGLVEYVLREEHAIHLPGYLGCYTDAAVDNSAIIELRRIADGWITVPFGQHQPGDIVLFNMGGTARHMGAVVGGDLFIHALEGRDTCIESLNSLLWRKRVAGFYRYCA
jgi:cell wall-associated NlpC family hydrolase